MNVFAMSDDPVKSALWLDDVRKNKMIVESGQLLSTAMNVLDPNHRYDVYRTAYVNHPCAIWVRESPGNFRWLLTHMQAMVDQRGLPHKTASLLPLFEEWASNLPDEGRTPFVNCTTYKWVGKTWLAYRMQMRDKWDHDTIKLSWAYGERPSWYK